MANIESKRSTRPTQPSIRKTKTSKARKRPTEQNPPPLRPPATRQGKLTLRRYDRRHVYRLEGLKGRTVDYVNLFTSDDEHAVVIRFEDKTMLHLKIALGFALETEHAEMTADSWRSLRTWPLIRSVGI